MIKFVHNKIIEHKEQFIKYFIIGITGVVLDILSLYVLKEYFHLRPVIAVVLNQIVLINLIFLLNKRWSFQAVGDTHKQIVKFYILSSFNYLFSILWMWSLNEHLLVNYLLARMINIALAVSWNFLIYKYWVYKK